MIVVLEANAMPNVESLLRDHVTLQVDCIDRLYLNGYVPLLQRPGNVWWFLHEHRKHPVISPALLKKITDGFVGCIQDFAEQHKIPVVHFEPDQRKEEIACKHLARGCKVVGAGGAYVGTAVAPGVGTAVGGFIGCTDGAFIGYVSAERAAGYLFDWAATAVFGKITGESALPAPAYGGEGGSFGGGGTFGGGGASGTW